jgi:NAD(P)-dependent dehydrogenase (short-subunit alcohol dehydrogenase family)
MKNPFSLSGKTVLVTGASSGIGRATAVLCSEMGANVIITARNQKRLAETFNMLQNNAHHLFIADLTNARQVEELIDDVPFLDGCVFCAGVVKTLAIKMSDKKDLEEIFDTNTFSAIYLTQLLIGQKKLNKNGSLVYLSSISGTKIGAVGGSLYGASKAAIEGFAKGAALELAPRNIRVNTIAPGMIETPIFDDTSVSAEQLAEDAKRYPLKRYGKPEEVANAAVYLLSDAAQWITGTTLLIDGGYTLV